MSKTTKPRPTAPTSPADPTTAVYQRIAEGWDPACKECERLRAPCGAHPRNLKLAVQIQDKTMRAAGAPERAPTTRARAVPAWIEKEALGAVDFESRSLLCSRILAKGEWDGLFVSRALAAAWGVSLDAVTNYRRAGAVANAAARGDTSELLEDTFGSYRTQERECHAASLELERQGRHGEASRYRDLAQKARARITEVAGLLQHRITISLEADPRFAGLIAAQFNALEAFDALAAQQHAETERVVQALLAEVERLNGGVLPAGLPELPVALPSAQEHVRGAVKRYEAEIGARKLPSAA